MMTDLIRQLVPAGEGDAKPQLDLDALHASLPPGIAMEALVIDAKSIEWQTMNAWRL